MMQSLYKNWAKSCFMSGLFLLTLLLSSYSKLGELEFWVWLQVVVYLWHQTEEHAFPGGFREYINREVFHSSDPYSPLSEAGVFWINILIIWVLFPVAAILSQHLDIRFGVFLPVFGLFNATTHILLAIRKRQYNPGLAVSALLNYPTGLYTLRVFDHANILTASVFWLMFAASFVLHIIMVASVACKIKGGCPFSRCRKNRSNNTSS